MAKQKRTKKSKPALPELEIKTVAFVLEALRAEAERLEKAAKVAAREGGPMLHHAAEQWVRSSQCEVLAVMLGQMAEASFKEHGIDPDYYMERP